jgi:hypothetical protein
VLMLTLNNGLEVVVLYFLEGIQPFTRRHLSPLAAAVPLSVVALGAKALVPGWAPLAVGVALGLTAYAATPRYFGFTPAERRLAGTLTERNRSVLPRS